MKQNSNTFWLKNMRVHRVIHECIIRMFVLLYLQQMETFIIIIIVILIIISLTVQFSWWGVQSINGLMDGVGKPLILLCPTNYQVTRITELRGWSQLIITADVHSHKCEKVLFAICTRVNWLFLSFDFTEPVGTDSAMLLKLVNVKIHWNLYIL